MNGIEHLIIAKSKITPAIPSRASRDKALSVSALLTGGTNPGSEGVLHTPQITSQIHASATRPASTNETTKPQGTIAKLINNPIPSSSLLSRLSYIQGLGSKILSFVSSSIAKYLNIYPTQEIRKNPEITQPTLIAETPKATQLPLDERCDSPHTSTNSSFSSEKLSVLGSLDESIIESSTNPSPQPSNLDDPFITQQTIADTEAKTEPKPMPLVGFLHGESRDDGMMAFMQMMINTPSLLQAYLTIGNYYKNSGKTDEEKRAGQNLLDVFNAYTESVEIQKPVDAKYAELLSHSFDSLHKGKTATLNRCESLLQLITNYEEVLEKMGALDPFIPRFKVASSGLNANTLSNAQAKIPLIPLPLSTQLKEENTHPSFTALLDTHFPIDKTPDELLISIQRFSSSTRNSRSLSVPLEFNREESVYTLTSFIIYTGVLFGTEKYQTYRKIENEWFLCDGENVNLVPEEKVKEALNRSDTLHYQRTKTT